jgi:hypothetical protein
MAFKASNLELADSRRAHYYEGPMAGPMEGPVTIPKNGGEVFYHINRQTKRDFDRIRIKMGKDPYYVDDAGLDVERNIKFREAKEA